MFLVFVLVVPVFAGTPPQPQQSSGSPRARPRAGADTDPAGPVREAPDEERPSGLFLSGVLPEEGWEVSEVPGEGGPVGVPLLQERVPALDGLIGHV
ncbi:hypothetical protein, partial [Saccharopolyspora sp. NPDC049357]|uniref:hypothetical protein n=1 Tax=Saccharopolyspora sp. NPDC049357 TaxID=3154507 RepID=UPI00342FE5F3